MMKTLIIISFASVYGSQVFALENLQMKLQCGAETHTERFGEGLSGWESMGFPASLNEYVNQILDDPFQQQLAQMHQNLVDQISGRVDRVDLGKEDDGTSLNANEDGPEGFEIKTSYRVGLFTYNTPEGEKAYQELLTNICSRIAGQSGFEVTQKCVETTIEKIKKTDEYLEEYRLNSENFADKELHKTFPTSLVWEDFHPQDKNACPARGSQRPQDHRYARDDVFNTAMCWGVPYFLGSTDLIVSDLLFDKENRLVGRVVKMSRGQEVETYYAPFIPGGALLNPVHFNVIGGDSKEWNDIIESKLGTLRRVSI